jgi:hypothetical protein
MTSRRHQPSPSIERPGSPGAGFDPTTDLTEDCPTTTFVRPSPRPGGDVAAPGVGTTQILTSEVLRPVMRAAAAAARPRVAPVLVVPPVRVAPAPPDLLPAADVREISVAEPDPEPVVASPTWTLERKLLAANLVLGLLVLVEFLAF